MRKREFKRPSKMAIIGGSMTAIFFVAIVIALPWHIWQSYAATTGGDTSTGLRNVRSIWATATAVSEHAATATVVGEQAATATAISKKKTPTPTATVKATPTVQPTPTVGVTPTVNATATAQANADLYPQFCRYFYGITTTAAAVGPSDKYADCLNLSSDFQSYLQAHNITVGTAAGSWPGASLVALEVSSESGKTGNSIVGTDASTVEDSLSTYLQGQSSQQTGYQDAMTNWNDDPLLSLALVTYTFDSSTGKPIAADATDDNPSYTAISTFLLSDSSEVAKIQADLQSSVQSTAKPAGGDCSFTVSPLTQAYQQCLGSDSLVDLLCDERYTTGEDSTTLLNSVSPIVENEFSGEVNTYLQAHSSGANAATAQQAYAFISSVSNQKMKVTLIDHVLTDVLINR